MTIIHDPQCTDYGSPRRPEQPARVVKSVAHLRAAHPTWEWRIPAIATDGMLLAVHTPAHLRRLQVPPDFDEDTPYFDGIYDHARRAVGAALCAMNLALVQQERAFALMRPPGHHATAGQAMGFCYLNQVAIAAVAARARGAQRVAVWDFDAHHGNGTEQIFLARPDVLFVSIHSDRLFPQDTGSATTTTVTVSGLPSNSGGWNVYVYCFGDNWETREGTYTISGTGITTASVIGIDTINTVFNGTFVQASNSPGTMCCSPSRTSRASR